jgi:hypothetical protein
MERPIERSAGIGLFLAGLTVGVVMAVGVGTEEGKRLADRLGEALRNLADNLGKPEAPQSLTRPELPPPPTLPSAEQF